MCVDKAQGEGNEPCGGGKPPPCSCPHQQVCSPLALSILDLGAEATQHVKVGLADSVPMRGAGPLAEQGLISKV